MNTGSRFVPAAKKLPASVLFSLSLHALALTAFVLTLRALPKRAARTVPDVDILVQVPKPRLSALEFMKLALPAKKSTRAAARERMQKPIRPAPPSQIPELTTRHDASQARYRKVAERYLRGAEQGDVRAQFSVAGLYYIGHGVAQNYEAARSWYQKAAEQGDAVAQTNLGTMYYMGRGVPVDYDQALHWYRKAAQKAYPAAQSIIGAMYEEGHGVARDYTEALSWYRKAAAQDDPAAEYNLGLAYENGLGGLAKDDGQALKWYRAAANQDYEPARRERKTGDLWERARAEHAARKNH